MNQTNKRRNIAPNARKTASTRSAGANRDKDTSKAKNAPKATVGGSSAKRKPDAVQYALTRATQAALAIRDAGSLLAKAAQAMDKARTAHGRGRLTEAERDAKWLRQWGEMRLILSEHADALAVFAKDFMLAGCFREIAKADIGAEAKERLAERIAYLKGDDGKGGAA